MIPPPDQMRRIMALAPACAYDVLSRRVDAKKARRRLPRQVPPTRIEEDYAKHLVRIVGRARGAYAGLLRELPKLLEERRAAKERGDRLDAGEGARVKKLVAAAADQARSSIRRDEVEALARRFAQQTSTYQRLQFTNQVRAALGVDPIVRDRGLAAAVDQFTHENAALITRIPERLHGDLEAVVQRAVSSASPHPALAEQIEERFGVAERHARLIARDQVSKFFGSMNHARQRELGVEKFVWRTAGDERVRDEHEALDGQEFSYDDPPAEGLPSEPVLCRCSSEPVFDSDDE